ncbi:alanine--tRNA ligase [Deinococcus maricopensis]|uniref:Alanine--tRNA ligase n=1 Tax=Deinococcus maricopensis (strain DSM 21211 / LMG 22137 / NRRL B-23946 / LB-34) TaxID=709986 RepID=E8U3Q0_DEIML|nr:alanine--tRNA ligase [Deinococcus maricopensis]ADV68674.1 alanyl-tRNA synthetase [Deinococcus maricopensis DSM 21211]
MPSPTPRSTAEIREKYLQFFESKGHLRLPSHSLIAPDPTTLFTVAGMQPFKPQFMGSAPKFSGVPGEHRRVTTAQKCIRVGDIENVGRTRRHLSLFEMLGNFSFGDYFKRDAIHWAWEFLTGPEWMGLDASKLYVTIYEDDDEAFGYWTQEIGLDPSHVHRFGADENFWPADAPLKGPNGPCGPCSEIYFDRGPAYGDDSWADYATTRESARFLEIWNLVFPQFDRQDPAADGSPVLADLPFKNIDTGMGLERIASVVQDVPDFYSNDVFKPLVERVAELSGKPYEGEVSVSHRVIAEHVRSVTMTVADGVVLSNTGRGYVIRKILRRASRHAYLLGLREPTLHKLVPLVVEAMGGAYPEVRSEAARVEAAIRSEEERFLRTLESGMGRLDALLGKMERGATLSGEEAFTLYGTYGFPLDLTREIAEEYGVSVDEAGFDKALEADQELARAGSKYGKSELFGVVAEVLGDLPATTFVGYDELEAEGRVLAIVSGGEPLSRLTAGSEAQVVLDRTPMYAEGGGEVGDTGVLTWDGGEAAVLDTRKTPGGVFLHTVEVLHGELSEGAEVRALVNPDRQATERHHTATHLLHAALRAVLGSGVRQAGSLVAPDRLRFDFTHGSALSADEVAQVEALVNRWVTADFPVTWRTMPIDEARASGAMALFGEKYGDEVRVVSVEGGVPFGDTEVASRELCGGAHVTRTGEIGAFVILSDENVAAGVRRVEALAGEAAVRWVRERLGAAGRAASSVNATVDQLPERIAQVQAQLKAAQGEIAGLKRQLAQAQMGGGSAGSQVRELGGFKVAAVRLSGVEGNELRGAADSFLEQTGADVAVVAGDKGLVVKATKDAVGRGAHAGQLIGKLAAAGGGKGGGRPDMAQAGVQDADAALGALDSAF